MSAYDPLTLAGIVGRWAVEKPDFTVLTVEGAGVRDDETRTYAEMWDKGRALAAGLRRLGLKPGDMVGTLLANHAEFVDLMVAGSLLGIAIVPIDPRTRGDKLVYMLASVGCKGVIAGDYALPELLAGAGTGERPAMGGRPAHGRGQGHHRAAAGGRCPALRRGGGQRLPRHRSSRGRTRTARWN